MDREVFSCAVKDHDPLDQVNAFLSQFRGSEVTKLLVWRTDPETVQLAIEVQTGHRLRIVASSPADNVYLRTDDPVDVAYVVFSEPVDFGSILNRVWFNEVMVNSGRITLMQDDHKVRIDLTDFVTGAPGEYRLEFDADVKMRDGTGTLQGRRITTWSTTTFGGTKGGDYYPDEVNRRSLRMAKVPVERGVIQEMALRAFYQIVGVQPADVVESVVVEDEGRADIFVLYEADPKAPLAEYVTYPDGSCLYWDTSEPLVLTVSTHFDAPLDTSVSLDSSVWFDDQLVPIGDIRVEQDGHLLEVVTRPAAYGHHWMEFLNPAGAFIRRSDEFFTTYVVHPPCCGEDSSELPLDAEEGDMLYHGPAGEIPPYSRVAAWKGPGRKVLTQTGDGVTADAPVWDTLVASDVPTQVAGSSTQVQFNDAGVFGGDAGLVFEKVLNTLTVGGFVVSVASGFAAYKDSTPTKAVNLGMSVPGGSLTDEMILALYDGSAWFEAARVLDGGLRLSEPSAGGSSYFQLTVPALAGNTPYTLPAAYPASNGEVLSSTTTGAMSWLAAQPLSEKGQASGYADLDANSRLLYTRLPRVVVTAVKNTPYTAAYRQLVRVDPSLAGFAVTLPAAALGEWVEIKNVTSSTNTITVTPDGTDLIDDAGTLDMTTAYQHIRLVSTTDGWMVA